MPPQPQDAILPWDWAVSVEGFFWLVTIILVSVIFLAIAQGRDRKNLPNQLGREVEDFAGVTMESNGPLTRFLIIFYAVVAFSMVTYMIITLASGYNY